MTREEINELPLLRYEGPITLVETPAAALEALELLRGEPLLGFDTETRAAFRKGESYKPSLLQLCGADAAYLFRLRSTGVTPEMCRLLADPGIVKAGVAVARDIQDLQEMRPFTAAGFVDLGDAARKAGLEHHGLRGLAALLLHGRMSKRAQRTNWARLDLTAEQIGYAATDAWVGRELYQIMKRHGLLIKNVEP